MAKLEATDGFAVYGWMRLNLGLSGGELLTYAIVNQFSQKSGAGHYTGGVPYISAFIGCSDDTARKYLHTLANRGLIFKIDATRNGVPYQNYKANPAFIPSIKKTPEKIGSTPENLGGGRPPKNAVKTPEKIGVDNNKIVNTESNNPPSPQEVAAYCRTQGFKDPDGFAAYYCAYQNENGWMTGKGKNRKPIDNWKLNVISWGRYHKTETFTDAKGPKATRTISNDEFIRSLV